MIRGGYGVSDIIYLENTIVSFHIGCTEKERRSVQPVRLDVEMEYDTSQAGTLDDLSETLNYVTAFREIESIAASRRFKLLESISEAIADALLDLGAQTVRVKASKACCPIPGFQGRAAIGIERRRED